jgi:hypothetical protein
MKGCLRGIVGKVVVLLLVVAAAYAGWLWGPEVFPRVHDWLGISVGTERVETEPPTPELADSVSSAVQTFRRGEGGAQMALGGEELTAVLRYSVPGMVPDGVAEPEVRFRDGRVHLGARVALDAFPDLPDLGPILGILPDTLQVRLEGSLLPFGVRKAAFLVHHVEASRVPLPRRLIPEILRAMGREEHPGLPPEAITVSLPSGLGSAYILTDSLILSKDP